MLSKPFVALVYGFSGESRIEVMDYDFGKVKLGNLSYGEIEIRNTGLIDLIIYGVRGPFLQNVFISYVGEITASNPVVIHPKEYKRFVISFYPNEARTYNDTIFFMSTSNTDITPDSIAVLTGEGYTDLGPIINVSDAEYGYVVRYTKTTKNIEIKNTGDKILYINNYLPPQYYLFKENISPEITPSSPLTLNPNSVFNFDVEFTAEAETHVGFTDRIIFNSNAVSGDSIAILKVDSVVIAGIDDFANNNIIKIQPNPFSSSITIDITGNDKPETIIIYDIFGRTVLTKQTDYIESLNTQHITLHTENLNPGIYYLRTKGNPETNLLIKIE
jgi:hypothetical protein